MTNLANVVQNGQNIIKGWSLPKMSPSSSKFGLIASAVGALALCIFLAYTRHSALKQVKALQAKSKLLETELKSAKALYEGKSLEVLSLKENESKFVGKIEGINSENREREDALSSHYGKHFQEKNDEIECTKELNKCLEQEKKKLETRFSKIERQLQSVSKEKEGLHKELEILKSQPAAIRMEGEPVTVGVTQAKMQKIQEKISVLEGKVAEIAKKLEVLVQEKAKKYQLFEEAKAKQELVTKLKKEITEQVESNLPKVAIKAEYEPVKEVHDQYSSENLELINLLNARSPSLKEPDEIAEEAAELKKESIKKAAGVKMEEIEEKMKNEGREYCSEEEDKLKNAYFSIYVNSKIDDEVNKKEKELEAVKTSIKNSEEEKAKIEEEIETLTLAKAYLQGTLITAVN